MPTYVYRCDRCDETIEAFQSFSDEPLRTHEGCGGALTKLFHPTGVVFKGSGFYKTDSRASKGEPNGGAKSGSKGGEGGSSSNAD